MITLPDWALNFNLIMNLIGLFGVSAFIATYSRVRFERTRLGVFLMSGAIAVWVLSGTATIRRFGILYDWAWAETVFVGIWIGMAWGLVGLTYCWLAREIRREQSKKTEDSEAAR